MSSTNRGDNSTELWETPSWCVRRLLEEIWLPPGEWLEPMAGNGRIIRAVDEDRPGAIRWTACELRSECAPNLKQVKSIKNLKCPQDFIKDFEAYPNRGKQPTTADPFISLYDVGITNPAFSLSMDTLSKLLVCCEYVVMLQRLNWLGSGMNNGKHDFLTNFHPDVYMLPDRVKFLLNGKFPRYPPGTKDGNGKNIGGQLLSGDSIEYCWYVWGPKENRRKAAGIMKQLRGTAKEERIALEEAFAA